MHHHAGSETRVGLVRGNDNCGNGRIRENPSVSVCQCWEEVDRKSKATGIH